MTVVCEVTYQMILRKGEQMVGDMGHMGGLINPRPGRGQHQAGFSNTGGSPKPRKRAPCQKNNKKNIFFFPQLSILQKLWNFTLAET